MTPATTGGAPYKVPREHDGWRSLTLAAAMHALLLLFLWFGVHWQSNQPVAVEAEVWDMSVQQAAPPAPPAPPAPEPQEEPAAQAPPPVAPPVEAPPAPKEPDIALERQKAKQKAAELKAEEEAKQAKLQKQADEKLAKQKAKDDARKKELAEEKAQEEKDRQEKQDQLDKKLAADKKAAADKLAKAKLAADQKAADKARAAEMSRITGAVGAGTVGTAAKSTGPRGDASYQGALIAAIRSRLAYSSSDDTLTARVTITQLPTGEVLGTKMVKSSGNAAYDSAILRAIGAASPLPKKKDGTVEREITADFNLKDLH